MKENTYEFMIKTGKYLPEENIASSGGNYMFFAQYNYHGDIIYFENSDGYWRKREYNSKGLETYHESSYQGIVLDER